MNKQEALKTSLNKLLTDYKLTPLELNVLFYVQGSVLSRVLSHKKNVR